MTEIERIHHHEMLIEQYAKRAGSDVKNLFEWLKEHTDFHKAPASTDFHNNYEGGLYDHSVNCFKYAMYLAEITKKMNPAIELPEPISIFLATMYHDLCKCNIYKKEKKWVKEGKNWISYEGYVVDDQLPIGHGEKSLYMIAKYVTLSDAEALAIRWHMGYFDPGVHFFYPSGVAYKAASKNSLCSLVALADAATSLIEKTIDYKSAAVDEHNCKNKYSK